FNYDKVDELVLFDFNTIGGTSKLTVIDDGATIQFILDGGSWSGVTEIPGEVEVNPSSTKILLMTKSAFEQTGDKLLLRIFSSINIQIEFLKVSLPNSPIPGSFIVQNNGPIYFNDVFTNFDNEILVETASHVFIGGPIDFNDGNCLIRANGNLTQTETISGNRLGLDVFGLTTLTKNNDINYLSITNDGETLLNSTSSLIIDQVTVNGITIQGVSTSNDDVKLNINGSLNINESITLGNGDLFLNISGNVFQSESIQGAGLGLMVSGTSVLQNSANNFVTLSADNGGETLYLDVDNLVLGTITVDGMTETGIRTSNDDVKLSIGGSLTIYEAIALGFGDLFLDVAGDVTQTASISGAGLELMVSGTSVLQNSANNFVTLSTDNGGETLFRDADNLDIGSITVDGMTVTGISTTSNDVKLSIGGSLTISEAIAISLGDLFLDVAGSVTQTASISGAGLGLMVSGTSVLQNGSNNFVTLAADNGGETLFRDADNIDIGTITVDGMTVTGISTTSDDASILTGGNLIIDNVIQLSFGDLLLESSGDVIQNAQISGRGLALRVNGVASLTNVLNDFEILALDNVGTTKYTDSSNLLLFNVNVSGQTILGITQNSPTLTLTSFGKLSMFTPIVINALNAQVNINVFAGLDIFIIQSFDNGDVIMVNQL
ncbi:MAG: hypothetical protein AAGK97_02890, partial [Bacteroidota bacterium]